MPIPELDYIPIGRVCKKWKRNYFEVLQYSLSYSIPVYMHIGLSNVLKYKKGDRPYKFSIKEEPDRPVGYLESDGYERVMLGYIQDLMSGESGVAVKQGFFDPHSIESGVQVSQVFWDSDDFDAYICPQKIIQISDLFFKKDDILAFQSGSRVKRLSDQERKVLHQELAIEFYDGKMKKEKLVELVHKRATDMGYRFKSSTASR
jgi:hypothetical protein